MELPTQVSWFDTSIVYAVLPVNTIRPVPALVMRVTAILLSTVTTWPVSMVTVSSGPGTVLDAHVAGSDHVPDCAELIAAILVRYSCYLRSIYFRES